MPAGSRRYARLFSRPGCGPRRGRLPRKPGKGFCTRPMMDKTGEPVRPFRRAPQRRMAALQRRAMCEGDIEAAARQQAAKPVRPFDKNDAVAKRLLEAELVGLLRPRQTVEIEMPDHATRGLVGLDER